MAQPIGPHTYTPRLHNGAKHYRYLTDRPINVLFIGIAHIRQTRTARWLIDGVLWVCNATRQDVVGRTYDVLYFSSLYLRAATVCWVKQILFLVCPCVCVVYACLSAQKSKVSIQQEHSKSAYLCLGESGLDPESVSGVGSRLRIRITSKI